MAIIYWVLNAAYLVFMITTDVEVENIVPFLMIIITYQITDTLVKILRELEK